MYGLDEPMLEDKSEILDGRYRVVRRLGSGAFGEIYEGMCVLLSFTNSFIPHIVEKKKTGEKFAAKVVSIKPSSFLDYQKYNSKTLITTHLCLSRNERPRPKNMSCYSGKAS